MRCIDNNAVTYAHYRLYRLDVVIYFCISFFVYVLFSHFVAGQIICRLIL